MKKITVISTEVVTRETVLEVPDHFDAANEDHREVADSVAMDYECGERDVERTITIEAAAKTARPEAELDDDDVPAPESSTAPPADSWGTWTFLGHWEDGEIVVDATLAGEQEDTREDTGQWDGGLWADSASAATEEDALAELCAQYEDDDEGS